MASEEEEARTRIRRALGVVEPHPGLRARVIDSTPIDGDGGPSSRRLWVAGGVAVLLALTVVAGLMFVRRPGATHSASTGHLVGALNVTTQLGFQCTLPVQGYLTEARISLPDGAVFVDQVQQQGKGTAQYGSVYAGGKWVPVPRAWLSPDSKSYAYITNTTGVPGQPQTATLYVHDIARGTDRKLWSGTGYTQMIGWGPGGVYFTLQPAAAGLPGARNTNEVWVVAPANPSAVHRVGPNPPQPAPTSEADLPIFQFGTRIAGDQAWTVKVGIPKGPIPPGGGNVARNPSEVIRMDLKDGSVSTWFTAAEGTSLNIAGLDSQGHPILTVMPTPKIMPPPASPGGQVTPSADMIYPSPPRVLLLTGPNQTVEIADGSNSAFRPSIAMGDSHGIWFNSPGSLWIYRQGSLAKVAEIPAGLFPLPTPPPNAPTPNIAKPPPNFPSPPPGFPTGVSLALVGPCTQRA
ncbi:MAG TPA: hypothetical protein VKF14_15660 [Candidatus Dormibacteraeota bacterium]|nr:hypothetical protein [Candidatus Dormibacteraeota bacterium]